MKLLVITKKKAHNLKTRYILICYRPSISDLSGLNTTTHIYFIINVFVDLNNFCKRRFSLSSGN